jgi:hypothetical protein
MIHVHQKSSPGNVDINELGAGLYQVRVTADDGSIAQRRIIEQ